MALKDFIKENFVLVTGLALPVLLVALFFFASVLPKSMAVPPQYEMLFTTYRSEGTPPLYNVNFVVKNGMVTAQVTKNNKQPSINYNIRQLMAYDGKTQSVRELPYDISKIGDVADGTEIVFDEFKSMKVDSNNKAPDGYAFDNGGYRSRGIMHDIWGGGGYNNNARVVKSAVAFKIPDGSTYNYYYYDIRFLGWVVSK